MHTGPRLSNELQEQATVRRASPKEQPNAGEDEARGTMVETCFTAINVLDRLSLSTSRVLASHFLAVFGGGAKLTDRSLKVSFEGSSPVPHQQSVLQTLAAIDGAEVHAFPL